MTKVLVHGNPETDAIWIPLVHALADRGVDDIVRLSPPGFGAPAAADFDALPASYVEWLATELRSIDGPIDLLGHDWGAGHVFGLAAHHPDLIRSWAADCGGLLHPAYEWHDAAQSWQAPGEGEEAVGMMQALSVDDRSAAYGGLGLPPDIARSLAEAFNDDMSRCILALYRGAVQPALAHLGDALAAADRRPSLVINATDDPYVGADLGAEVAERNGAQTLTLEGKGHWWMVEDPGPAADGLVAFWASLS